MAEKQKDQRSRDKRTQNVRPVSRESTPPRGVTQQQPGKREKTPRRRQPVARRATTGSAVDGGESARE
ncbi:MAG: hypothetical protein ACRELD_14825 [Longimicrobiales bacterium]